MKEFDYIKYINENPLLKETSGYGNYTRPESMLEYISDEEFDTMADDELDAAEDAGDLESSDAPLGPDEETMEEDVLDTQAGLSAMKVNGLVEKIKQAVQAATKKLNDDELEQFRNKLQQWAQKGFPANNW